MFCSCKCPTPGNSLVAAYDLERTVRMVLFQAYSTVYARVWLLLTLPIIMSSLLSISAKVVCKCGLLQKLKGSSAS